MVWRSSAGRRLSCASVSSTSATAYRGHTSDKPPARRIKRLRREWFMGLSSPLNGQDNFLIALHTRSGVSGNSLIRAPVLQATALATAGATGMMPPSPMPLAPYGPGQRQRSEEHTSELQSLAYLVCRL